MNPEVYRQPHFLDADTCRRVRLAMDAGDAEEAEILSESINRRDDTRRAASIEIAAPLVAEIETRLDAQQETIAAHFGTRLSDREGAGFLRYQPGGFYTAHRDRAEVGSWPAAARRRIAVVVFLNSSRRLDPAAEFDGGILRLFGTDGARDVYPRGGELIAFPADVVHEVTPVSAGQRDVIVDWFYDAY